MIKKRYKNSENLPDAVGLTLAMLSEYDIQCIIKNIDLHKCEIKSYDPNHNLLKKMTKIYNMSKELELEINKILKEYR